MTEQMQKQEVSIGGETVEVITREEAERAIFGADPRTVVAYAFEAAVCPDGGAAMICLQLGSIASHSFWDAKPPDEAAYALLWTEDNSVYESVLDDAYRGADGLAGSLLDGREIDGVDAESLSQSDVDDYLMETTNEGYRDRLGRAYARELSDAHELPKPNDFSERAQAQLDAIYGEDGGGATQ